MCPVWKASPCFARHVGEVQQATWDVCSTEKEASEENRCGCAEWFVVVRPSWGGGQTQLANTPSSRVVSRLGLDSDVFQPKQLCRPQSSIDSWMSLIEGIGDTRDNSGDGAGRERGRGRAMGALVLPGGIHAVHAIWPTMVFVQRDQASVASCPTDWERRQLGREPAAGRLPSVKDAGFYTGRQRPSKSPACSFEASSHLAPFGSSIWVHLGPFGSRLGLAGVAPLPSGTAATAKIHTAPLTRR
jgi:hypothetical protein